MKFVVQDVISYAAKTVNEDLFDHNDQAAWIFDGASGIVKDTIPGTASDPHWLVHTMNDELKQIWDDSLPTRDLLLAAIEATIARYNQLVPNPPQLIERPTACFAMVRLWQGALEISTIYDSGVLYRSEQGTQTFGCVGSGTHKIIHKAIDQFIAAGATPAEIPALVLPLELDFRRGANIDGGYDIIDLTTRWINRINTHRINPRPMDCLLLTTDGLYRLIDIIHQYDAASLLDIAEKRGLASLYRELREIENNDSACTKFPRAKISDDVAAALILVS